MATPKTSLHWMSRPATPKQRQMRHTRNQQQQGPRNKGTHTQRATHTPQHHAAPTPTPNRPQPTAQHHKPQTDNQAPSPDPARRQPAATERPGPTPRLSSSLPRRTAARKARNLSAPTAGGGGGAGRTPRPRPPRTPRKPHTTPHHDAPHNHTQRQKAGATARTQRAQQNTIQDEHGSRTHAWSGPEAQGARAPNHRHSMTSREHHTHTATTTPEGKEEQRQNNHPTHINRDVRHKGKTFGHHPRAASARRLCPLCRRRNAKRNIRNNKTGCSAAGHTETAPKENKLHEVAGHTETTRPTNVLENDSRQRVQQIESQI